MTEVKRSYYLPQKLLTAFGKECSKFGCIKQNAVAASLLLFLDSSPDQRSKMFNRLDSFQNSKT